MKVAIVGPREVEDYNVLLEAIKASTFNITEVVSGGAKGVDTLAEKYAEENNLECTVFEANWNDLSHDDADIRTNQWGKQYDARAGFRRNQQIVDYCDAMIAIDNGSSGTNDSISKMKKTDKPLYIHSLIRKSFGGMKANEEGYIYEF